MLPPAPLRDYVQYFWMLESPDAYGSPVALGPLADGCPGLIFQPATEGAFYEGMHKQLPELFLYGQTVTRTRISLLGRFQSVGVCAHYQAGLLRPVGLLERQTRVLFGFPASPAGSSASIRPFGQVFLLAHHILSSLFSQVTWIHPSREVLNHTPSKLANIKSAIRTVCPYR
jgi:hypothetical protein